MNQAVVLRYGHRLIRDQRVTTHCCLVARAFGAQKIIIEGEEDPALRRSLNGVNKSWGAGLKLEFCADWRPALKGLKRAGYCVVHLTMYGLPLRKTMPKIRKRRKLCVVIGSQKVEPAVYAAADYNLAVGPTPHSEIAALAVFLHELFQGKELEKPFKGAKLRITPMPCGKLVTRVKRIGGL